MECYFGEYTSIQWNPQYNEKRVYIEHVERIKPKSMPVTYICMYVQCMYAAWNKFNNKQSGLHRKLGWLYPNKLYPNTFHSSGGGGCGGVMDNQ